MNNFRLNFILISILLIGTFFRFYNLMHDAPYFFNPDERNMANAVTQFRLPGKLSQIPICLVSQFFPHQLDAKRYTLDANSCNLNPNFFAYGQFPLYLALVSDQIIKPIINLINYQPSIKNNQLITNFPSAIFWLRFYSALASALTIFAVYRISQFLIPYSKFSILAALMAAFSPGLIQSAHFGTTESILTFCLTLSIYLSFKLLSLPQNNSPKKLVFLICLVTGISLGSKLTGLFILVPPITALLTKLITTLSIGKKHGRLGRFISEFRNIIFLGSLIIIGSVFFFIISSPYNLIDYPDFYSAVFGYEKDVAMGKYEVFYTRQFVGTTPILFQAEKIFPYALGWPVFIIGTIGFLLINLKLLIYSLFSILQKYQISKIKYQRYISKIENLNIFNYLYVFLIFDISFVIYFIPNAFLFAKWTRFMTPIFPFFAIFASYFLYQTYFFFHEIFNQNKILNIKYKIYISKIGKMFNILNVFLIFSILFFILLPGAAFMSIYTHEDSRVTASKWIYGNIPNNSYVLSETANVVDIPLGLPYYNLTVISFDFYHLDDNPLLFTNLINHLEKSDYIFIPSRRIFTNYTRLPARYPLITKYYQLLFSGTLGYEKVQEISSFPRLEFVPIKSEWNLSRLSGIPSAAGNFNDEQSEETYTVFDHPVIRIYKKIKPFTKEQYRMLFEN